MKIFHSCKTFGDFLLSVWLNFLFDYSSLFPFLFFLLLFYDSQRGVGVFSYRIMLQAESVGVVFEIKNRECR